MTLLSPYRVLDLTDDRGHLAGFILARLGAEVIAIEPPGSSPVRRLGPFDASGASLTHASYARGKRSVELDIATEDGADALRKPAAGADVLIESALPGHMASLGLGPDALAEINPALVVTSISPFGQTGPKAGWAATDLTVWASGGPMHMCGDEDRAPLGVGVPQAFLHAAGQAASATVLALVERNQSGLGQHIDVSAQAVAMNSTMSSVLCSLVNAPLTLWGGGGIRSGPIRLRVVYPAKDGFVSFTHVFGAAIGPATGRMMALVHEAGFCDEATASKDWVQYAMALSDGSESLEEFERIKECVANFTASRTKDELFALALERRLLLAPVATTADLTASEQLASRDYWDIVDGERYPGHWMKPEPGNGSADRVPTVGEHTAETLARPRRPAVSTPPEPSISERPLEGLKVVDFSRAEASVHFIAPAVLEYLRNGTVVDGRGNHSEHHCPHGVFPAAGDDRWVAVVAQDDRAWTELAGLIGHPSLAVLPLADRLARREELEAAVSAWTSRLEEADVEERCQAAGIAAHRVQNSPELAVDPQLAHRGHWVGVPHSTHGTTIIEAPRFTMSRSRVWPERAAPALGEHLYEVLTEHLGYDADKVAELAAAEAFD